MSVISLAAETEAACVQDFTPAQNHLEYCYAKQQAADIQYDLFLKAHTRTEILADPILTAERDFLKSTSRLAWLARLRALPLARKPSLEDALWIVARAGYTSEIKPCMNLCRSTRDCKHLQVLMKNAKNENGLTQLAYFASKGFIESVKKLLTCRSININANDAPKDETALHLAAPRFPEMCRLLLENGADVNALNEDQETPLYVLCDKIRDLLNQSKDEDNYMRIKTAGYACLQTLLEFDASIDECDVHERTALHQLCFSEDVRSFVALLLDHGADIEARTEQGWTPYFISTVFRNERVRKELERRNADVDAVDNEGRNPVEYRILMKQRGERGFQLANDLVRDLMRNLYDV